MPVLFNDGQPTAGVRDLRGPDPWDSWCFAHGRVSAGTIKSAKGHTAHVCDLAYVHRLDGDGLKKEARQRLRAKLHVACTRPSLFFDLWGVNRRRDPVSVRAN